LFLIIWILGEFQSTSKIFFFFHSSLFTNYYFTKHFLLCYFIIILFNYAKDQKILPNIEFFFSDRNISAWSISYLVDMSSVFVSSKIQGGLAPPRPALPFFSLPFSFDRFYVDPLLRRIRLYIFFTGIFLWALAGELRMLK
jgi:hypothetical protein